MQVDAAIDASERDVLEEEVLKTVQQESDSIMDNEAIELSLIEQLKSETELAQYDQDLEEAILAQSMAEYFESMKTKGTDNN
jgi:NurA-like 5'-3' nuclease